MATTMKLIAQQTLSVSAASVTLGSGGTIPQTYDHLLLLCSGRADQAYFYNDILLRPNGSTSNATERSLLGYSGGTLSGTSTAIRVGVVTAASATSNVFGSSSAIIMNYSTSANKTISMDGVSENNSADALRYLSAGLWSNSSPITSLVLVTDTGANFVAGSTFTLYGITKA